MIDIKNYSTMLFVGADVLIGPPLTSRYNQERADEDIGPYECGIYAKQEKHPCKIKSISKAHARTI